MFIGNVSGNDNIVNENDDDQQSLQILQYVEGKRKDMLDKLNLQELADIKELNNIWNILHDTTSISKFLNKWDSTVSDLGPYGNGLPWFATWPKLHPVIETRIKNKYQQQRLSLTQCNDQQLFRDLLVQDQKEQHAPSVTVVETQHLGIGGRYVYDVNSPVRCVGASTNIYRKRDVVKNSLTQAVLSYGEWTQYEVDIPPPPPSVSYGNQSDGNNH